MFQLITLYATAPRVDPAYFERYEAQLRSSAEYRAADPDSVLFDTLNTVRRQSHFRARPLTPSNCSRSWTRSARKPYTPTGSRT